MGSEYSPRPQGVHLVGSLPQDRFSNPTQVFTDLSAGLAGRLRRIPDGELGERHYYIQWQESVFPTEILRSTAQRDSTGPPNQRLCLEGQYIKPLKYDDAALASYEAFDRARKQGAIPAGVRFQVSLPAPLETTAMFVQESYQEDATYLYEQRLLETLCTIQQNIPPQDLAIQWDLAVTIGLIEAKRGLLRPGPFVCWLDDPVDYSIRALQRVAGAVSPDVEMGFHLCYGDMNHEHFIQPEDMSVMVGFAKRLIDEVQPKHSISWLHMPVPRCRIDRGYFAPLKSLQLPTETELYLGLLHPQDSPGAHERIKAAREALGPQQFGVAAECGLGRTPSRDADSILSIAAEVTDSHQDYCKDTTRARHRSL